MRQILFILLWLASVHSFATTGAEEKIALLEARLAKLEAESAQLRSLLAEIQTSPVVPEDDSAFTAEELEDEFSQIRQTLDTQAKVSGYADVEYRDSDASGVNPGVRIHHLSVFFTKQFDQNLRFFSEIEFEDGPVFASKTDGDAFSSKNGKIFLEAANLTYRLKPGLTLRAGRFFTPTGIWSEDHYPPFVTTQERPLIIRRIFPQLIDGAGLRGSKALNNSFVSFDLFAGNGEGNTASKDENSSKATGLRLRLERADTLSSLLGLEVYRDRLNTGDVKTAWGMHLKLNYNQFELQSELAQSRIAIGGQPDTDKDGWYTQLKHHKNDWSYGVRFERFDEDINLTNTESKRRTAFINYHYNANTVVKFEYHDTDRTSLGDVGSYVFSVASFLGL